MKGNEPMNWTKRETQYYGIFMAILGCLLGLIVMSVICSYKIN